MSPVYRHIIFLLLTLPSPLSTVVCADVETVNMPAIEDERALPYQFVLLKKWVNLSDAGSPILGESVPIERDSLGQLTGYIIRNNYKAPLDTKSCLTVTTDLLQPSIAMGQYNFNGTDRINSHRAVDIDNDGVPELLVTFTREDTLYLAVLHILDEADTIRSDIPVVCGVDRDNSGSWDGSGSLVAVDDFTPDDGLEALVVCISGFDLYPRGLYCVNLATRRVVWSLPVAGHVGSMNIVRESSTVSPCIVMVSAAPNNGAREGDMADSAAYLLCCSFSGELRWMRQLSPRQAYPRLARLKDLETGEVLHFVGYRAIADTGAENDFRRFGSDVLQVYDNRGKLVKEQWLAGQRCVCAIAADIDRNEYPELLIGVSDSTLRVYDSELREHARIRFASVPEPFTAEDFTGDGRAELLVSTSADVTWLLSSDFEALAMYRDGVERPCLYTFPSSFHTGCDMVLGFDRSTVNVAMTIRKSVWFSIFFRKPWLAAVAAFVPTALILGLVLLNAIVVRRKNKLIAAVNTDLEHTLAELRTTQDKLIAAEKFTQAQDIAGGFAHEIRNALFPATSWLAKLKRAVRSAPNESEQVLQANRAVLRAIEITNRISSYTKLDAELQVEVLAPRPILEQVVEANRVCIEEQRVAVKFTGELDMPVRGNSKQLYTVFNNLMLNSLDALTDSDDERIITVAGEHTGEILEVRFGDTGGGIKPEDIGRVFDTFFTTKPHTGTGLGLAMTRKIVEMYGGSITVASSLAKGTEFTLRFRVGRANN